MDVLLEKGRNDLEHFSAKWIRFAVKKCGNSKRRDDSTTVETALDRGQRQA
jgi:hypothetical protein